MKITIQKLKQLIRDQVERNLRWSAGFFTGGGISRPRKGVVQPPPDLGSSQEDTDTETTIDQKNDKQEKTQLAVRVYDRSGNKPKG